jgi:hypothetical protein
MEPITVKAKLHLKTYYQIALLVYYRPKKLISILIVFACINVFIFLEQDFSWASELGAITALIVIYGIIMPAIIWFGCKRNMRTSPVLREGITYYITDESIEGIAPDTSNKTNWKLINKVVEKNNYFLLFNSASQFRYLPKSGFDSDGDVVRFKEIVKENRVKAYFK